MMCHLCSPSDFDEIPAELGSNFSSYSYERILPYFTKSQSHQPASAWPHAPHPARGKTGPVRIGYSWINELCASFVDACASLGVKKRMDLNVDEDGQGTLGVSRTTTFIHEGCEFVGGARVRTVSDFVHDAARVTSATSYLTPDVIKRPNLMITVNATVSRPSILRQQTAHIRSSYSALVFYSLPTPNRAPSVLSSRHSKSHGPH